MNYVLSPLTAIYEDPLFLRRRRSGEFSQQCSVEPVSGFEPLTVRLQGGCSAKLSYTGRRLSQPWPRSPSQGTVSGLSRVTGCRLLRGVDAEHLGARPLAWTLEKRSGSPNARWESPVMTTPTSWPSHAGRCPNGCVSPGRRWQSPLTDRESTLAEFEGYLRTVNNRDGRPYEERRSASTRSLPRTWAAGPGSGSPLFACPRIRQAAAQGRNRAR